MADKNIFSDKLNYDETVKSLFSPQSTQRQLVGIKRISL